MLERADVMEPSDLVANTSASELSQTTFLEIRSIQKPAACYSYLHTCLMIIPPLGLPKFIFPAYMMESKCLSLLVLYSFASDLLATWLLGSKLAFLSELVGVSNTEPVRKDILNLFKCKSRNFRVAEDD